MFWCLQIVPCSGLSSPTRSLIAVDLPAPLAPTTVNNRFEVSNESWQMSGDVYSCVRMGLGDNLEDDLGDLVISQDVATSCPQLHLLRNNGGVEAAETHDDES